MSNADLKQLTTRRKQVKSSLIRFTQFVDKCKYSQEECNIMQLKSRLENAYTLLEHFNNFQNDIEILDENEIGSNERSDCEENYYSAMQIANKIIQTYREKEASEKHSMSQINPLQNLGTQAPSFQNVRFPVIDFPKFYGDYEKWGQFRDMFTSLVHNEPHLDHIKKLVMSQGY